MTSTLLPGFNFYRNAEGGGGGEGGDTGGDGGGDTGNAGATDDGTGGKTSLMQDGGDDGGKGGEGDGDTGSKQIDVKALLGDELAGDRNIAKFLEGENPVQEIAKALQNAQAQVGKPKVGVPGEQATAEEKAAFYEELGVPKEGTTEAYKFTKPENMPDELYSEEHAAKWAQAMKDNNVPVDAANALRDMLIGEQIDAATDATKALNDALDKDFGENKDIIAKEVGEMMKQAIPDDALRQQIEAGIGDKNTPAFAVALGHIMQHMKKQGFSDNNTGDGGSDHGGMSVDELREKGQALMASDAYRNPMHKNHAAVKKEADGIYKTIGELTAQAKKK
jgi:hypothetical protein